MFKVQLEYVDPQKLANFVNKNPRSYFQNANTVYIKGKGANSVGKLVGASKERVLPCSSSDLQIVARGLTQANKKEKANQSLPKLEQMENKNNESKYRVAFTPPTLDFSSPMRLEASITAIKHAKECQAVSDKELIYLCVNSGSHLDLIASLNTEQKTDVDQFISHLRQCYGANTHSLKKLSYFEQIKQNANEPDAIYLNRLANVYFESRDKQVPKIEEYDATDAYLIKSKFVQTLNCPKVKTELMKNFTAVEIKDLATRAKQAREATFIDNLEANQKEMKIMAIEAKYQSDSNNCCDCYLRGRQSGDRGRSHSRDRRSQSRGDRSSSRGRNEKKVQFDEQMHRCWRCGKRGHYARQCHASPKTVAEFRKRMDRECDNYSNDVCY